MQIFISWFQIFSTVRCVYRVPVRGPPCCCNSAHYLYLLLLFASQNNKSFSPPFVSAFVPLLPQPLLLRVLLLHPDTMEVSWRHIQESFFFFLSFSGRLSVCRTQTKHAARLRREYELVKAGGVILGNIRGATTRCSGFVNKDLTSWGNTQQMGKQSWVCYILEQWNAVNDWKKRGSTKHSIPEWVICKRDVVCNGK